MSVRQAGGPSPDHKRRAWINRLIRSMNVRLWYPPVRAASRPPGMEAVE